jgi:adenine-specific DNA-methyltransferase
VRLTDFHAKYFAAEPTLDLIRTTVERKPERAVCLDEGFAGNGQLKVNAVQIVRSKGVVSFKTV